MRPYATMSTRRLEQMAHKLGVDCQIRMVEAHQEGRYFVTALGEAPLKTPVAIGFTDDQAAYTLKQRTWERYVLRGAPTRLK